MEAGGIQGMQVTYAVDLWRLFGVSYLDQERLAWWEFEWMVATADRSQEG